MFDATYILAFTALVAAFGAIASPVLVIHFTSRAAADAKRQDWDREDEKAQALKDAAATVAKAAETVAVKVDAASKKTDGKLDEIHVLANSQMTASIEETLAARQDVLLALRRELVQIPKARTKANIAARKIVQEQIIQCEERIAVLTTKLEDRKKATEEAAKVAATAAADATPVAPGETIGILVQPAPEAVAKS